MSTIRQRGHARNAAHTNIDKMDPFVEDQKWSWYRKVRVPFNPSMSKNKVWAHGSGRTYIPPDVRKVRDDITWLVKAAMRGQKAHKGKLWLGIFVQKHKHTFDAINVLDLVADAVKDALGLDDNSYSLLFLDWEIAKERPQVAIYIGQAIRTDHFMCTACGVSTDVKHLAREAHCKFCIDPKYQG